MVMEDNEQLPALTVEASVPRVVERPVWVLSRDEQRVLIITFVGGLASIIAGACVIGVAIAVARYVRVSHYPLIAQLSWTGLYILFVAVLILYRRRSGTIPPWIYSALLLLLVPAGEFLLAWIGMAAGIH
jgi:hypothetical protein